MLGSHLIPPNPPRAIGRTQQYFHMSTQDQPVTQRTLVHKNPFIDIAALPLLC